MKRNTWEPDHAAGRRDARNLNLRANQPAKESERISSSKRRYDTGGYCTLGVCDGRFRLYGRACVSWHGDGVILGRQSRLNFQLRAVGISGRHVGFAMGLWPPRWGDAFASCGFILVSVWIFAVAHGTVIAAVGPMGVLSTSRWASH